MSRKQMLSILLLIVVIAGFSGFSTANTDCNTDKQKCHNKTILVSPAWNETIDGGVCYHPAEYETICHNGTPDTPPWNETICTKEAWNETIPGTPAWNESVECEHDGWFCNPSYTILKNDWNNDHYNANQYWIGFTKHGFKVVDDTGNGNNKMWEACFETICHPKGNDTIICHEAEYETICHNGTPGTPPWNETILKCPEWYEDMPDTIIFHDAVYKTIIWCCDHDKHHHHCHNDTNDNETTNQTTDNETNEIQNITATNGTIPMQTTGFPMIPGILALLAILTGSIVAYKKK